MGGICQIEIKGGGVSKKGGNMGTIESMDNIVSEIQEKIRPYQKVYDDPKDAMIEARENFIGLINNRMEGMEVSDLADVYDFIIGREDV